MVIKCLNDGGNRRRDLYHESRKHVFVFSFVNCFVADVLLCKFSSYFSNAQLKSPFFYFSPLFPFLPILTSASVLLLEVREKSNELGILPPVFLHVVVPLVLKVLL